ncbi:hypothetical protein [Paenibacillus cineris]|uniref:hypothetical protein n=1 Tax=Paenibacillus cineris TaxID=237530 RepID=UPI001B113227|nr:hypothetical protein [Paenibacillus cineris]GIO60731.1 hypothetical protein J43TS9_23050 [Paenibacillus cineris]
MKLVFMKKHMKDHGTHVHHKKKRHHHRKRTGLLLKVIHDIKHRLLKLKQQFENLAGTVAELSARVSRLEQQVANLNTRSGPGPGPAPGPTPGPGPGPGTGTSPDTGPTGIVALLMARMNSRVTLETPVGTIFGTLILIGEDYVQILEDDGSIVLIPVRSLLAVS